MSKPLPEIWTPPRRNLSRVAFLHPMSVLEDAEKFRRDIELIGETIRRYLDLLRLDWDALFAYETSPLSGQGETPYDPVELHKLYWRGMHLSEIVIAHGGDNGTSNLGALVEVAITAPQKPQILFLVPEGTEVSRAWLGYQARYPRRVLIEGFSTSNEDARDVLVSGLQRYLFERLEKLENGPADRQLLERVLHEHVAPIQAGWARLTELERAWIADDVDEHIDFLCMCIEDPLLLARMSIIDQSHLTHILQHFAEYRVELANRLLGRPALSAWREWTTNSATDPEHADWTLTRAISHAKAMGGHEAPGGLNLDAAGKWAGFAHAGESR